MTKWAIAAGVIVLLVAALLWKVLESPAKRSARSAQAPVQFDAGPAQAQAPTPTADAPKVRPKRTDAAPDEPPATVEVMDPKSEEFAQELDTYLLDTFRADAAPCYKGPLDDRKMVIAFQLRIEDGVVFASNVHVKKSDMNDPVLERCFVSAVENKRFSRRDLPNFEEETELFIRLRALKKYRSQDEQTSDAED